MRLREPFTVRLSRRWDARRLLGSCGGWGAWAHREQISLLRACIMHHSDVAFTLRCFGRYNVTMPKQPFTHKICPHCKVEKPRSDYYKKGDTVSHKCKPCSLEETRENAAKYIGKYADRQNEWRKTKYQDEPEYREKIANQKKARYERRKSEINAARRNRWATDPNDPARKYYRRKDVKEKTPPWIDLSEVLKIHAACPAGHEVDHIVPLRGLIDGRPVSGLHVPWNLQYLTMEANRKKKNRLSESDLNDLTWQWLLQSQIAHLLGSALALQLGQPQTPAPQPI